MAVSDKSRSGALAEVFASERKIINEQLRVALPGIIQSFDPDSVTAVMPGTQRRNQPRRFQSHHRSDF